MITDIGNKYSSTGMHKYASVSGVVSTIAKALLSGRALKSVVTSASSYTPMKKILSGTLRAINPAIYASEVYKGNMSLGSGLANIGISEGLNALNPVGRFYDKVTGGRAPMIGTGLQMVLDPMINDVIAAPVTRFMDKKLPLYQRQQVPYNEGDYQYE